MDEVWQASHAHLAIKCDSSSASARVRACVRCCWLNAAQPLSCAACCNWCVELTWLRSACREFDYVDDK